MTINFEIIKKINKAIVHEEDGTIDSFDKQIIRLLSGLYDTAYPMIVSPSTACISYVSCVNQSAPLLMNVTTAIKIKEKHNFGFEFVSNCEKMLRESVLAFESMSQDQSLIILLDEFEENTENPIIAICRYDKDMGVGGILVNEITSIYDKDRFANFLVRSYEADKHFYKNKKTGPYFTPNRLQLPEDIEYALSDVYHSPIFSKSQVNIEKSNISANIFTQTAPLSEQISSATARALTDQEKCIRPNTFTSNDSVKTNNPSRGSIL